MSKPNQDWIEVVVGCSVVVAEGLANELVRLVAAAKAGVQVRKDSIVFWVHPEELEATLDELRACLRRLQDTGWQVSPSRVSAGAMAPEADWRDAWKKYFHVTRLTRQIVVVPSWERYRPAPSDLLVHLDPGQAFGTGGHASTQLVLEELQTMVDEDEMSSPETIFDLGTGSGILAIASALFWPSAQITATDIDELSICAARENAIKNKVQERIRVSNTPLEEVQGHFPLILANLQAHILRTLKGPLLPRLAPTGHLLVSGILTSQIRSLADDYCLDDEIELVAIRRSTLNADWSSAHFQRIT